VKLCKCRKVVDDNVDAVNQDDVGDSIWAGGFEQLELVGNILD
jgi:hypothetical protein